MGTLRGVTPTLVRSFLETHARISRGYWTAMLVAEEDPASPGRSAGVSSCADLIALLGRQHDELRSMMVRLPQLQGAARMDVFLQIRRRLAVHEVIERLLVTPRAGDAAADEQLHVHQEIRTAELCDPDSLEFDAAYARVVVAHLHHAQVQEAEVFGGFVGELTPAEQAAAATATRLWVGEGEHYLGNTYLAMVATAQEELTQALHS